MHSLLGLTKGAKKLTIKNVFRYDIIPWFLVVATMAALYWVAIGLVMIATDKHDPLSETLAQSALGGYRLFIVGFLGCFLIVRTVNIRLWIVCVLSGILYLTSHGLSLSDMYFNNALLTFMLIAVMVLSIMRLMEYVNMRYRIGLQTVEVSFGALSAYIIIAIVCVILTNFSIAEWIVCSSTDCSPV